MLYGLVARASPICSACLSSRAIVPTPTDRAAARGYFFTARIGLRPFATGSASAFATIASSQVDSVTRLQRSLHATAQEVARPALARTFTLKLSPPPSPESGVKYDYPGT